MEFFLSTKHSTGSGGKPDKVKNLPLNTISMADGFKCVLLKENKLKLWHYFDWKIANNDAFSLTYKPYPTGTTVVFIQE